MAACLLILLFIKDELSYDRYNQNFDRIFRVTAHIRFGGQEGDIGTTPPPLAATCRQEFPEVESAARLYEQGNFIVQHGERSYTESRLMFADASIFQVFTLPLQRGNPQTALAAPRTIVLSETTARKYFGAANPLGQTLRLDNQEDYQVSGVFRDIPANSHFHFDLIASLESIEQSRQLRWDNNNYFTYLLLRPGSDPAALQAKFPGFVRKHVGPWIQQVLGRSIDEVFASGARLEYHLQPLRDIHLRSQLRSEIEVNGDIRIIYIFSAIALLILVIAAINFINLSTARSAGRSKEAGIRKVLGSERRQLVRQFLADSLLLSCLAIVLALLLTYIAMPWFNDLTAKRIEIDGSRNRLCGRLRGTDDPAGRLAGRPLPGLAAGRGPAGGRAEGQTGDRRPRRPAARHTGGLPIRHFHDFDHRHAGDIPPTPFHPE